MTVRRNKETREVEVTGPGVWKYIMAPGGYRILLLGLILSQHPIGRQLLGTFGFEFPDQRKLNVATEEASTTKTQIEAIARSVDELKKDFSTVKDTNSKTAFKVESLEQVFHGFQIDFNKWKTQNEILK